MNEKNTLLLAQLKQVRKEKDYSYQDIVDECERIGYSVSMSTVRRVFAPGSEEQGFRFATLRPIARVLLDLDEHGQRRPASPDEAEALRTVISIKEGQIADLQRTLDEKNAEIVRLNKLIDCLQELIDRLRGV